MPSIISAGSIDYPSGSEVALVITSSGTTSLATANLNNPVEVYAAVPGVTLKMPAATTAGLSSGQSHFPIFVHQGSFPILVRNGGVQANEPTLESVLSAGAHGRQTLYSAASGFAGGVPYSTSAGFWGYEGVGKIPMCPPLSFAKASMGTPFTASGAAPGAEWSYQQVIWLGGSLGAFFWVDGNNNIYGVPFQVSADGSTATAGTATLIQSANSQSLNYLMSTCVIPGTVPGSGVVYAPSGVGLLGWWNPSLSSGANVFCPFSVTSGATPTLNVGTSGSDSTYASGNRIYRPGAYGGTFTNDYGQNTGNTAQWLVGPNALNYDQTVYYIGVSSGLTMTLIASGNPDTVNTSSSYNVYLGYIGASPASGAFITFGNNVSGATQNMMMCYVKASGSALSTVWCSGGGTQIAGGVAGGQFAGNSLARIDKCDNQTNQYVTWSKFVGESLSLTYINIDSTYGPGTQVSFSPPIDQAGQTVINAATAYSDGTQYVGDGQYLTALPNEGSLVDLKIHYRPQPGNTPGTSIVNNASVAADFYSTQSYVIPMPYFFLNGAWLGESFAVDKYSRRIVNVLSNVPVAYPNTNNLGIFCFNELPRR